MMFGPVNTGAMIFQVIVFLLIILLFVSFFLFVRRLLINQGEKVKSSLEVERKLDKIIQLLEDNNPKK